MARAFLQTEANRLSARRYGLPDTVAAGVHALSKGEVNDDLEAMVAAVEPDAAARSALLSGRGATSKRRKRAAAEAEAEMAAAVAAASAGGAAAGGAGGAAGDGGARPALFDGDTGRAAKRSRLAGKVARERASESAAASALEGLRRALEAARARVDILGEQEIHLRRQSAALAAEEDALRQREAALRDDFARGVERNARTKDNLERLAVELQQRLFKDTVASSEDAEARVMELRVIEQERRERDVEIARLKAAAETRDARLRLLEAAVAENNLKLPEEAARAVAEAEAKVAAAGDAKKEAEKKPDEPAAAAAAAPAKGDGAKGDAEDADGRKDAPTVLEAANANAALVGELLSRLETAAARQREADEKLAARAREASELAARVKELEEGGAKPKRAAEAGAGAEAPKPKAEAEASPKAEAGAGKAEDKPAEDTEMGGAAAAAAAAAADTATPGGEDDAADATSLREENGVLQARVESLESQVDAQRELVQVADARAELSERSLHSLVARYRVVRSGTAAMQRTVDAALAAAAEARVEAEAKAAEADELQRANNRLERVTKRFSRDSARLRLRAEELAASNRHAHQRLQGARAAVRGYKTQAGAVRASVGGVAEALHQQQLARAAELLRRAEEACTEPAPRGRSRK